MMDNEQINLLPSFLPFFVTTSEEREGEIERADLLEDDLLDGGLSGTAVT